MSAAIRLVFAVAVAATLVGCGGYELRGKVIDGPYQTIEVVSADDPRLKTLGIPRARVQVTIDPDIPKSNPEPVVETDGEGGFAVPISAAGAGMLEYDVEVLVRREGMAPVIRRFPLPGSGKRLLVTAPLGEDDYLPEPDALRDTMRDADRYLDKGGRDLIDETLRDAEPYLR